VPLPEEYQRNFSKKVANDLSYLNGFPEDQRQLRTEEARKLSSQHWNRFYRQSEERFFKDRKWILKDFPEIDPQVFRASRARRGGRHLMNLEGEDRVDTGGEREKEDDGDEGDYSDLHRIFEMGCGAGSTLIPILKGIRSEKLRYYGCDLSEAAVASVQRRVTEIGEEDRVKVFVHNVSSPDVVPFSEGVDIVIMIFVLSAMGYDEINAAIANAYRLLRPGGMVLLRDYAEGDLTQFRFKPDRCLDQNLYIRGDGTRAYFLNQESLRCLMLGHGFEEVQNKVIRMLRTNRKQRKLMHRVMLQGKYVKPR